MAQIYESGNITLKIDSLNKKEHFFIDNENNTKEASLFLFRKDKNITIFLSSNKSLYNEDTFKNIVNCYNNFISNNKKFNEYHFGINNLKENIFDIYAIKKDLKSPVNLLSKEQIDELDKNSIPYLLYINSNQGFSKFYGNNNECFIKNNDVFVVDKQDGLDKYKFFVDTKINERINLNGRFPLLITMFMNLKKNTSYDKDTFISIPSFEALNINNSTKKVLHLKDYNYDLYRNDWCRSPLDLSKIDTKKYNNIMLSYKFNKETLYKTLNTINNIQEVTLNKWDMDRLKIKLKPIETTEFLKKYNGKELLNELKNQQNELTI